MASATYSRDREMAIWTSIAPIGATIAKSSAPMVLPGPSSSLELPPNRAENCTALAMPLMTAARPAATVAMVMSRLRMCAISWAMTPRTSRRGRTRSRPAVTATAPLAGLRPVAKALA